MRKYLAWAVALMVAVPSIAEAQVVVGVGGGLGVASLSADDDEDFDSRTGVNFGAFVGIPVNETFSIQPGLQYIQKGATQSEGVFEASFELTYIQVPLLGVFHVPSEGSATLHLFAGPTLAFEASCKISFEGDGESESGDCEDDDVETNSFDLGAMAGAAVSYAVSESASLFVSAFYNLGLSNVNDSAGDDDTVKNRLFGFNVGVVFPIGNGN